MGLSMDDLQPIYCQTNPWVLGSCYKCGFTTHHFFGGRASKKRHDYWNDDDDDDEHCPDFVEPNWMKGRLYSSTEIRLFSPLIANTYIWW